LHPTGIVNDLRERLHDLELLGLPVNPAPVYERLYITARAASMVGLGAGATWHLEAGRLNLRPPLRWLGECCHAVTQAFSVMSCDHFNGAGGGRAFLARIYSGTSSRWTSRT
jgi:hypothetical protein